MNFSEVRVPFSVRKGYPREGTVLGWKWRGIGTDGPFVGFGTLYPQWVGFTLLMLPAAATKLETAYCVILNR